MDITLGLGGVGGSTTVDDVTIESVVYKRLRVTAGKTGAVELFLDYQKGSESGLDIICIPHSDALNEGATMPLVSEASSPVSLDTLLYFTLRADTAWPSGLSTRSNAYAPSRKILFKTGLNTDYVDVMLKIVGTTWASATGKLTLKAVPYSR